MIPGQNVGAGGLSNAFPELVDGAGKGATLNCPFPAGSGRAEIFAAFDDKLAPAMEAFRPEFVLVSAGFDAHRDDDMSRLMWVDEDYAWLTREVMTATARHASTARRRSAPASSAPWSMTA